MYTNFLFVLGTTIDHGLKKQDDQNKKHQSVGDNNSGSTNNEKKTGHSDIIPNNVDDPNAVLGAGKIVTINELICSVCKKKFRDNFPSEHDVGGMVCSIECFKRTM